MATTVNKMDSNIVGTRIAKEASIGVLPVTPVWIPYEPNSFSQIGGENTLLSREPINPSRQRKKGTIVDREAGFGFETDLTQTSHQNLIEGVFFANFRRKGEYEDISGVTVEIGDDEYEMTDTDGFYAGSLVFASEFTNTANNGLKRVTAIDLDVSIAVAETLVAEASPPTASKLVVVGFQFGTADAVIDVTGTLPKLTATTKDLTELGLTPGEWVYLGGDAANTFFPSSKSNGWKRVASVAAGAIEFDKSANGEMIAQAGTGLTVQIFFGRFIRNEQPGSILRSTYQAEVTLGAPDEAEPTQIQSRYVVGCVPSDTAFNIPTAGKITSQINFLAMNRESRDGVTGVKSGTRPNLVSEDAYNTSNHFKRIKMGLVSNSNEAVTPLFAYLTDMSLTINNNLSANKAVGVLGAFDITAGNFAVSGNVTAYFTDTTATDAVDNNRDVTLDAILVQSNKGIVIDIPLIALGGGDLNIQLNEPITLPLTTDAAEASSVNSNYDYTASIGFFDYLPSAAN